MTKEEERRIKEGKKMAKLRAKEARKAEKLRLKQERKAAKEAKKNKNYVAQPVKADIKPVETEIIEDKSLKVQENATCAAATSNEADESIENVFSADGQEPEEETDGKIRPRNYHVSFREDGKWQVKFAKGSKALKLFDTQAEAIAFAKEKAENQDGSITIHKKDGKIRKQRYDRQ